MEALDFLSFLLLFSLGPWRPSYQLRVRIEKSYWTFEVKPIVCNSPVEESE
jgi:hypothetical protein